MKNGLEIVTRVFALIACSVLVLGLRDTPRSEPLPQQPTAPTLGDAPPPTARLCVDVVDSRKSAIQGASVRVYRELSGSRFALEREWRTKLESRCTEAIPHGTLWILSEAEGRARASLELSFDRAQAVTLELVREATLEVRVIDELSAPLEGATVLVTTLDPLPHGKRTDPEGNARFGRLSPGPWSLVARAPGYENATLSEVRENATVTLRRLASLDVKVVDSNEASVAEAAVVIAGPTLWPARRALTDAAGLTKIRGLSAGSYDLRATAGSRISSPLHGFELARGAHQTLTLRLEPGRMVTAVVTDGEGMNPPVVSGADVILVEDGIGSFPLRGRSGTDGRVTLGPITSRAATLTARAPEFLGGPLVAVPEREDGPVPVPLTRGALLRGEVVDARGYPIEGAQIEVVGTDRFGLPIAETPLAAGFRALHFAWSLSGPKALIPSGELGVLPGPVPPIPRLGMPLPMSGAQLPEAASSEILPWATRSNGEFVAKPVTPGRVRALVRHPEFVEGSSEFVTLAPSSEASVKIVLLRGGRLEGRVVDEHGYPVEGVDVSLVAIGGTFERRTLTSTDGTFAFAAVPSEVTLSAARDGDTNRVAVRRTLSVPEGKRVDVELLIPAPRDAVRILVVDEQNQPVDVAEVRVASLDPKTPLRTTLFTDASGSAELGDALGLPLRVSVNAPRFATLEKDFDPMPSQVRITLDPGVLVSGHVTAVRGRQAVQNARVNLSSGGSRRSTMTDAGGAFQFRGVLPGPVRIAVSHPDYAETTADVEVARTGRADRPFELPALDLSEPGSLEGFVVDGSARPVEGARVALGVAPAYLPQGALPVGVALTDKEGAFVLSRLPAGTVRVQAYAAGHGRGSLEGVVIDAGRATRGVRIQLQEVETDVEPLATGGVAITLAERANEVVVIQVAQGSEAERGGLRASDVISRIDGTHPISMTDARERLAGPAGSDVIVQARRSGAELRLRIAREPVRR